MKPQMIEEGARTVLYDWLHGYAWKLLHFWENEEVYLCVVSLMGDLLFIRMWQNLKDEWQLSQDNRIHMYEPDINWLRDGMELFYVCDEVR